MVGNTLRYAVDMLKANMKAAATLRGAYILPFAITPRIG